MNLVADANIVIAALISPKGHTADLFFLDKLVIYAPEFLLKEVEKYKADILLKTGLSEKDFENVVLFLSTRIKFLPVAEFIDFLPKAEEISPDPKDTEYFALALKFNCPLWSNDKLLKSQTEVKILSTSELILIVS